jgi:hypothetical protein
MAETFLEEQLRRIREMTEQVSRVRPLCALYEVHNHSPECARSRHEEPAPARKGTARDASRRRGR